jgi:hypothetical protein
MKTRPVVAVLAAAVLLTGQLRLGTASAAQSPSPTHSAHQSPNTPGMTQMHGHMMADMAAANATLAALVKDMNAASGDAKTAAMAAAITELVRQHKAFHERMEHMHHQMTGGHGGTMHKQ